MKVKKTFQRYNVSYRFSNMFSHNKISKKKYCSIGKFVSIKRTTINCQEHNSLIIDEHCVIHDSTITIVGTNNYIHIHSGVKINKSELTINASNCYIEIGLNTSINESKFYCGNKNNHIKVGNDCLIGFGCLFMTWDAHSIIDFDGKLINEPGDIEINNHVWISSNCTIFKNTLIGDNCVVGSSSFLKKVVLDNNSIYIKNGLKIKDKINWKA